MKTKTKVKAGSLSWIVQKSWKVAREQLKSMPSVNDYGADGQD